MDDMGAELIGTVRTNMLDLRCLNKKKIVYNCLIRIDEEHTLSQN